MKGVPIRHCRVHSDPFELQPHRPTRHDACAHSQRRGQRHRLVGALRGAYVDEKLNNEKIAYISTNTTANSYTTLLAKAADAVILTPPYTSMATLAGYVDFGNTYDVRDLQGGLVARVPYIHDHREQVKSMIRATVRSMEASSKTSRKLFLTCSAILRWSPRLPRIPIRFLDRSSMPTATSKSPCCARSSIRSSRNPASPARFPSTGSSIFRFCVKSGSSCASAKRGYCMNRERLSMITAFNPE